jgi:predicted DNA-binding antitoxin AbrB/MazE fold protein
MMAPEGIMDSIDAIFESGVFRPLGAVTLSERQRVRLHVEPLPEPAAVDPLVWLEQVRQVRQQLQARTGLLPDSAPDIAEDRSRDV